MRCNFNQNQQIARVSCTGHSMDWSKCQHQTESILIIYQRNVLCIVSPGSSIMWYSRTLCISCCWRLTHSHRHRRRYDCCSQMNWGIFALCKIHDPINVAHVKLSQTFFSLCGGEFHGFRVAFFLSPRRASVSGHHGSEFAPDENEKRTGEFATADELSILRSEHKRNVSRCFRALEVIQ